jgi:hypothetical protein
MAKGQMRSNKEKKKPKADKNIKKGGATPSPFSSGKTPAGQAPNSKKQSVSTALPGIAICACADRATDGVSA